MGLPRSARGLLLAAALAAACSGLEPTPQPTSCPKGFTGICGTVTFVGSVPESTLAVYIVAYETFPHSATDLFTYQPLAPDPLPLDSAQQFYTIPLPNGRYEWVVAAWLRQDFTPQGADSTLREAGFYRDGADTTSHGSGIVVVNGTGTDSIDFVIDFTMMHPIAFYFPVARQR